MQHAYPILEYDSAAEAFIEPARLLKPIDVAERCVVCFFQDVLDDVIASRPVRRAYTLRSEIGEHPLYEMEIDGARLAFFHPGVGAPLAAGLLEEAIALGCRKFVACGGAGVLDSALAVGHVIVPASAVRDEGTSYHYLPPAREVSASPDVVAAIEQTLQRHHVDYLVSKTWTTDAIYRETPAKIKLRRSEGCIAVEMEAAAFFAVARFRGVQFGQLLYSGDDLGGDEWDSRRWNHRADAREKLFWLAAETALSLP